MDITKVPIHLLYLSKLNVRKDLNSNEEETNIQNLADDIRINGLLSPLCVREDSQGKFEVFAGQRRLEALKIVGEKNIPCIIYAKDSLDDELINLSFSENNQRNSMSQKDKCLYYYKLYEKYRNIAEVSKVSHVSEDTVEKYIRVHQHLNHQLLDNLDKKGTEKLPLEVATTLMKIEKPSQNQVFAEIKDLTTTKQKLDVLRSIIDSEKPKNKSKKNKDLSKDNIPKSLKSFNVEIFPSEPWVFNDNNEKLIIPKELYGEIVDLILDYQASQH